MLEYGLYEEDSGFVVCVVEGCVISSVDEDERGWYVWSKLVEVEKDSDVLNISDV